MNHPYQSRPVAETHVWLTPPEIVVPLGPFDLDPCAAPEPRPWPTADFHYTEDMDGLSRPWFGRVWCNPPFGSSTGKWLERMAKHGNGIALAFARTDTAMFHKHVFGQADAVMFLAGRPKFYRPDGTQSKGNSGGPICLIAYGQYNARRLRESVIKGMVLTTPTATTGRTIVMVPESALHSTESQLNALRERVRGLADLLDLLRTDDNGKVYACIKSRRGSFVDVTETVAELRATVADEGKEG